MTCTGEGAASKGRVLVQTAQCNMKDCPCHQPAPGGGATTLAGTARLTRDEKVWTLRKLREAGVKLLGKWACPETIKQLEVCQEHTADLPKNIIRGLCGALRSMLVDCTGQFSEPCSRAAVFPTWLLSSGADALRHQGEQWAGYQNFGQLKRIAQVRYSPKPCIQLYVPIVVPLTRTPFCLPSLCCELHRLRCRRRSAHSCCTPKRSVRAAATYQ